MSHGRKSRPAAVTQPQDDTEDIFSRTSQDNKTQSSGRIWSFSGNQLNCCCCWFDVKIKTPSQNLPSLCTNPQLQTCCWGNPPPTRCQRNPTHPNHTLICSQTSPPSLTPAGKPSCQFCVCSGHKAEGLQSPDLHWLRSWTRLGPGKVWKRSRFPGFEGQILHHQIL